MNVDRRTLSPRTARTFQPKLGRLVVMRRPPGMTRSTLERCVRQIATRCNASGNVWEIALITWPDRNIDLVVVDRDAFPVAERRETIQ